MNKEQGERHKGIIQIIIITINNNNIDVNKCWAWQILILQTDVLT